MDRLFLVGDVVIGAACIASLEEAGRITQLDEVDIEWAIEEEGLCETDRHTVTDAPPTEQMAR